MLSSGWKRAILTSAAVSLVTLVGCSQQQVFYPVYVPYEVPVVVKSKSELPPVKAKVREIKKVIKKLKRKLEEREKAPF